MRVNKQLQLSKPGTEIEIDYAYRKYSTTKKKNAYLDMQCNVKYIKLRLPGHLKLKFKRAHNMNLNIEFFPFDSNIHISYTNLKTKIT